MDKKFYTEMIYIQPHTDFTCHWIHTWRILYLGPSKNLFLSPLLLSLTQSLKVIHNNRWTEKRNICKFIVNSCYGSIMNNPYSRCYVLPEPFIAKSNIIQPHSSEFHTIVDSLSMFIIWRWRSSKVFHLSPRFSSSGVQYYTYFIIFSMSWPVEKRSIA